jgi:CheY-like chemotaxis protein
MSKSILSVGGNRAMNYLLQTVFEKNCRLVHVSDVFQAMFLLRSDKQVKAIIIDLDYHPQQGWELIEHIKTSRLFAVTVIVLSSDTSSELKEKCFELGVDDMFFKPFNPVDLLASVSSSSPFLQKIES